MAMEPNYAPDPGDWVCARCQCPLEQATKFRSAILAVRLTSLCPVARPVD